MSTVAPERPEVAVVRHPIADGRNRVVGYELRPGGAVDLDDPSQDDLLAPLPSLSRAGCTLALGDYDGARRRLRADVALLDRQGRRVGSVSGRAW